MKTTAKKSRAARRNGKLGGRPATPDPNVQAKRIVDEVTRLPERPTPKP